MTLDDVFQFLKDVGFTPRPAAPGGDAWVIAEDDLGHLRPQEILSVDPLRFTPF